MMKIYKKVLLITNKSGDTFDYDELSNDCNTEIIRANSIDDALNIASGHDFAAAIIDTELSSTECCKILKLIQGADNTRSLPVILFSDNPSEENNLTEHSETVIVDYLTKPIKQSILAGKIKT